MKLARLMLAAASAALSTTAALAQTAWDMPTPYPASNFHTENIMQFVSDIDKATGGKLKITVHANASLFKAPEIKRAVQGNQAQIGEILLVNYENEDPFYGLDGIPFLATSYGESMKLYKASRKTLEDKLKDPKNDKKQLSAIDQPATQVKVGKQKAVRVVIEQVRPTGPTTPDDTLVVVRYLFWKDGKLLTLSMSSVKGINNMAAYDLIASSFRW